MTATLREMICIVCPKGCRLHIELQDGEFSVAGNACRRGEAYGIEELTNPTRTVTSTVCIRDALHALCPVKTAGPVPKPMVLDVVRALDGVVLQAPVSEGQVVLENVCDTGVDVITTRSMLRNE